MTEQALLITPPEIANIGPKVIHVDMVYRFYSTAEMHRFNHTWAS